MKIGIFGGTFDPFTCAHYEIVKTVLNDKLVDRVIVMPSIVKYYRSEKDCLFSNGDKMKILNKWFDSDDDNGNIVLDFHEYDMMENHMPNGSGYVYSDSRRYVDMLNYATFHYQNKYPDTRIEFYTILGEDSYKNFTTWHNWSEILRKSKLIVIGRSNGIISDGISRDYEEMVPTAYHRYIDSKFNGVSASSIRKRLVDSMSSMSMGPNATCLSLYLEEIEEYKKTGMIAEEIEEEMSNIACTIDDAKIERWKYMKSEESLRIDVSEFREGIDDFLLTLGKNTDPVSLCRRINEFLGMYVEKKREKVLLHTKIFDVVEGTYDETVKFSPIKIKAPDWVCVIAEKDGKFMTVTQKRHGSGCEITEFPCGMVENGELSIDAARRELEEETGISVERFGLTYLGSYSPNPAFMTNKMHYFYVNLNESRYDTREIHLDEHECLTSKFVPIEDILNMEADGKNPAMLASALWLWKNYRD